MGIRSKHSMRALALATVMGIYGGAAPNVSADTVFFTGAGSLGSFKGSMNYETFAGNYRLSLTLSNTSSAANGGFLTGVLFNVADAATDPNLNVAVRLYPNPTEIVPGDARTKDLFWDVNAPESAWPFGDYEAGAALAKVKISNDGIYLGPGNPTRGLGVGQTMTLVFDVTGDASQLAALSTMSFLTEGPAGGIGGPPLTARFKGFTGGGSDKTNSLSIASLAAATVPLPHAAVAGLPLLTMLALRRVRRGE